MDRGAGMPSMAVAVTKSIDFHHFDAFSEVFRNR